jgi:hypothetical protein
MSNPDQSLSQTGSDLKPDEPLSLDKETLKDLEAGDDQLSDPRGGWGLRTLQCRTALPCTTTGEPCGIKA